MTQTQANLPQTTPQSQPAANQPTSPQPNQPTNVQQPPSQTQQSSPTNPSNQPASFKNDKTQKEIPTPEAIRKKINRFVLITGIVSFLIVIATTLLFFVTNARLNSLEINRQQIGSVRASNTDLQETHQFFQTDQGQIDAIINALPNDPRMVDFVKAIETITSENSSSKSIEFSVDNPVGQTGEKYIPFLIKIATNTPNFSELLKKIEKLPYIVEIVNIEATLVDESTNLWDYRLSAKVYIQEPFN